jgi:hypothetical protein
MDIGIGMLVGALAVALFINTENRLNMRQERRLQKLEQEVFKPKG